jgi:hypothetical protein
MTFDDCLRLLTTLTSGIAAGVLFTVLTVLTPLVRELGGGPGLRMKNAQDRFIDRVNPPVVISSILGGVLTLIIADDLSDAATLLTIIGIAGMLGIGILSLGFNFPLNRTMYEMSTDPVPPEFGPVFQRWIRFHVVRTALGVLGFAGFAASLAVQLH